MQDTHAHPNRIAHSYSHADTATNRERHSDAHAQLDSHSVGYRDVHPHPQRDNHANGNFLRVAADAHGRLVEIG
ncbi:MAG TPA: hypothetical protein VN812_05930 [Candidatus Acidoferrales bacterium]|nr:hypothetical protein [Candidatus Acidoferrales bacterium]